MHDFRWLRKLTNKELADLPEKWENQLDTNKYKETPFKAYETSEESYRIYKNDGYLVQEYRGKHYVGIRP